MLFCCFECAFPSVFEHFICVDASHRRTPRCAPRTMEAATDSSTVCPPGEHKMPRIRDGAKHFNGLRSRATALPDVRLTSQSSLTDERVNWGQGRRTMNRGAQVSSGQLCAIHSIATTCLVGLASHTFLMARRTDRHSSAIPPRWAGPIEFSREHAACKLILGCCSQ